MEVAPPAILGPDAPRHVMSAAAGIHPDAANHVPGGGGMVGRRDRHGDDVGWGRRGAGRVVVERAAPGKGVV